MKCTLKSNQSNVFIFPVIINYLNSNGRGVEIRVNGTFHFLLRYFSFDQSCCWRQGSGSMYLANNNKLKLSQH